ncbi:adenosine kinase 2 [Exaiptasia diaphana]|uniref:Adenosine kinase n=1 Tax=Exaiptasia diaphana TaxID=2652724 RepID=A0A913WQW0_EXADI|nr:adenosine kinase 2 [Exaiptasia diaphana]KXJ18655.1 Adenosine kinase 2 [Exaiptasia diaphana]
MAPEAKKSKTNIYEGLILGMGNPLLDISAPVDSKLLQKYDLEANNAILADEKHLPIYQELIDHYKFDYLPGGATQNSMRVLQWFFEDKATAYMGCIGQDEYGKTLTKIMTDGRVHVNYLHKPDVPTGTCAVCITDKHRSLVANLGAANHYSKDHLDKPENWSLVEQAKYFYIAGFFLTVSPESIVAVGKHAADNNKTFMMNLSAPFLCEFFKDPMMQAMPYIDILFGNETELAVFAKTHKYETEDLKEIAKKIATLPKANEKKPRIVVITHGKEPTIVVQNGEVREFPVIAIKEDDIIDTNGAGDAFVGGFMSQLVQEKTIDDCVRCGHWAANYIIQQSGVVLTDKPNFK